MVTDGTRWRWVFYINLPIGIIALVALLIYLPTNISVRSSRYSGWAAVRRIDFLGAALASAATICLLLGLTWGGDQTYDWSSLQVIGTLVGAGVLYIAFFTVERFVAEPVLPLDLLRNRVFSAGATLSLLQGMILLGLVIYLPLYLQGVLGQSATNSGEIITPLTVSLVVGASLSGFVVAMLKRYQILAILGALIMTVGVFLMSSMTASTGLLEASIFMVVAGIGIGIFFSILTLAVQNALPRTRLGVGTGAVRYLSQLGSTLGVAIVGTVVNNTISSDIITRLPANAVQQLTPEGLKVATNPQVLVNPTYHDTVVHTAEGFAQRIAVAKATANIPAGSQHDAVAHQVALQAIQQNQHLLNQVFDALRLSLAVAIQHGFATILIFCVATIVAVFFLKDVPLAKEFRGEAVEASEVKEVSAVASSSEATISEEHVSSISE